MKHLLLLLLLLSALSGIDLRNDDSIERFEMDYFHDENGSMEIHAVMHQKRFTPITNHPFIKDPSGAHWFKITLTNKTDETTERILSYSQNFIKTFDFYELNDAGYLLRHSESGIYVPVHERSIRHFYPSHQFKLKAGETKHLLVRIEIFFQVYSFVTIKTPVNFVQDNAYLLYFYAFFYGVIVSVIIYNLFIYIKMKENVYLYYISYLLFFTFGLMRINGHTDVILPPELMLLPFLSVPLAFFFFVLFTKELLQNDIPNPSFQYTTKLYMGLWLLTFVVMAINLKIGQFFINLTVLGFFPLGIYLMIVGKTSQVRFYTLALGIYLIALTSLPLIRLDILPNIPLFNLMTAGGSMIEAMMLSLILANRMNTLREEKLAVQKEMMELQSRQNETLREKVAEQTRELTLLFSELHHRVKNNLQLILAFLWLKKKRLKDPEAIDALDTTNKRIQGIAQIHDLLYAHDSMEIDFPEYINRFVQIFSQENPHVAVHQSIDASPIDFDAAVTLGLILNELLTNSMKYAFAHVDKPQIHIAFGKDGPESYRFTYHDNGPGIDHHATHNKNGLGHEIIRNLCKRCHESAIDISSNEGFDFSLTFSCFHHDSANPKAML